jgi:hypothetical protein
MTELTGAVAPPAEQELTVARVFLDLVVVGVGDVDAAVGVGGDAVRPS